MSSTVTDPIDSDDTCPACGAAHGVQPQPAPPAVDAWSCTECGMNFATTVLNPELASIVSVLRTTAFLAVLRAEVFGAAARRAEHDPPVDVTLPPQTGTAG